MGASTMPSTSPTSRLLRRLALGFALVFVPTPETAHAQPSTSTSFVLSQTTVGGAGTSATSASFVLDGTLAQPAPVGTSSSTSYVFQSGFWTSATLFVPQLDLAVSLTDSEDPLPGGENLLYTVEVQNLGPSTATDVVVTGGLPSGTTLVATSGCGEDPDGAPTCSLGALGVGETARYTVEVSIDPMPPASIEWIVSATSNQADSNAVNDSANETTQLDATPPRIAFVSTTAGPLTDCATVTEGGIRQLTVTFSEDLNGVTDPESWLLVRPGVDSIFQTTDCTGPYGDDVEITLAGITYDASTDVAILDPGKLSAGLYRLFACADPLTDLAGNLVDGNGDGTGGDDFLRFFRTDPYNRFHNGHFDCGLEDWALVSTNPLEITYSTDDAEDSFHSGSAAVENLTASSAFGIGQCLQLAPGIEHFLSASLRLEATESLRIRLGCEQFDAADCGGSSLGIPTPEFFDLNDTSDLWPTVQGSFTTPDDAVSALCSIDLFTVDGNAFDARIDRAELRAKALIFADGFESGDTDAWSEAVQ